MSANGLKWDKMAFSEFVKDLLEEIKEHRNWGNKDLEFCTMDGDDLKYLSICNPLESGYVRINVGIDLKNETTFKRFIEGLTKDLKRNPDWGDKELEFYAIDKGNLEYLSIYDSDDGKHICIDIGTEEDSNEWNKFVLG